MDDGYLEYNLYKPDAFLSRPFEQIKNIGVMSFSIRGTTVAVSQKKIEDDKSRTTITKTVTFPKQPDAVWDAILEKLYADFSAAIQKQFGAVVLPVDKVTGVDAYQKVLPYAADDKNTTVEFARSYKSTKVISAFMPMGEGFGKNDVNQKVLKESGADALLTLTLDLELNIDGEMTPKLAFELNGKSNNGSANTKYFTGVITGKGVKETESITPERLDRIVRRSDLIQVFSKALKELKEEEIKNGEYQPYWSLQN